MVIVSGAPLDQAAVDSYPEGGVERNILDIMLKSDERYEYASLKELDFELKLRKNIVNASNDLNLSGMDFEIFRNSRCNTDFWDRTDEGGFKLKSGVKPSDAIHDIFANGNKYGTECATAMVMVYYKALLDIFPEELFNQLFPSIELMDWHHIDKNLREIGYMSKPKAYLPGDRRYFQNPDVDPLKPEWQGENVIDLGNALYYGHGIGKTSAEKMIEALNSNRIADSQVEAHLLETAGLPNFKNLSKIYNDYINSQVQPAYITLNAVPDRMPV